jgi:hypothetical protein
MTIKVGPKDKHIEVPNGYSLVTEGVAKEGDMFCNVGNYPKMYWQYVEPDDIGESVGFFDVVVRKTGRIE